VRANLLNCWEELPANFLKLLGLKIFSGEACDEIGFLIIFSFIPLELEEIGYRLGEGFEVTDYF
jgi:hypothetical protein